MVTLAKSLYIRSPLEAGLPVIETNCGFVCQSEQFSEVLKLGDLIGKVFNNQK